MSADDTPAEPTFGWRRLYAFAALALNAVVAVLIVRKVSDPTALRWMFCAQTAANLAVAALYMAGASMADWARLTKAWRKPE